MSTKYEILSKSKTEKYTNVGWVKCFIGAMQNNNSLRLKFNIVLITIRVTMAAIIITTMTD